MIKLPKKAFIIGFFHFIKDTLSKNESITTLTKEELFEHLKRFNNYNETKYEKNKEEYKNNNNII